MIFFAKQCSLIDNNSKLPSQLHYLTDNCLSSESFSQDDIAKIIHNLDPNKAHDHDNTSSRMLKISGSSIYKPLEMIFKQCIETVFFLLNGKILFPFKQVNTEKLPSSVVATYLWNSCWNIVIKQNV